MKITVGKNIGNIDVDPMLRQTSERVAEEAYREFIRKTTEAYKQTDRYKEYEKRKLEKMESKKSKED